MSNPLYEEIGGNRQTNGIMQMVWQFQQFLSTLDRNPKEAVMQMLNSGKISQADLNGAQNFAKQFQQFLK